MESSIATIHGYLIMGCATLFLFQSLILFIRSRENKVRKTMAALELLWGTIYVLTLVFTSTVYTEKDYSLLRAEVLIVGSFYITFTHFFPIQVLAPGWLNWKTMLLLLLPNFVQAFIYYGGTFLLDESSEDLISYAMLGESIGHFNVWFRFVILLSNIIYLAWILKWLYGHEKKYIQWKNENFADQEYVDISWMRLYDYIVIGISILYICILFFGGRIMVMLHLLFVIISFSFLFYKSLFYENPFPEDFFEDSGLTPEVKNDVCEANLSEKTEEDQDESSFVHKMPLYTAHLKKWIENEKPYLFHDFKLTDVARVLPLNRSYLSRVFNEGFGQNFSEVVRMYRINYSKELLKNDPSIPMNKVASMSGFRSDTSFIRAFKQVEDITPAQYRVMIGME